MSLRRSTAPKEYSQSDEETFRDAVDEADSQNQKKDEDVEITEVRRLVLIAPDGGLWSLSVSNLGAAVFTDIG